MRAALLVLFSCLLIGCASSTTPAPTPPTPAPEWESGGARLHLAKAYWDRADQRARVEIDADGNVYRGDELVFTIDAWGRIRYPSGAPFAVLSEAGIVNGPNADPGGRVGLRNATLVGTGLQAI